jgi:type VI protein secretion system component VasF
MTSQGTEVDQQSELVRLAERTAKAAETISTLIQVWSCLGGLALLAALIFFFHAISS